jgi:hypothetical protein
MLRNKILILAIFATLVNQSVHAFDIEDYATTERATIDALIKAQNEFILAAAPHKSALEAYRGAVLEYSSSIKISSQSGDLSEANILKQK